MKTLTVECAAILLDGVQFWMPRPARHGHLINAIYLHWTRPRPVQGQQGFRLSDGTFASRGVAALVAWNAGQTKGPDALRILFSEDLW